MEPKLQYLIGGKWLDERDVPPDMREQAEKIRHAFYCNCNECKGRVAIQIK